MKVLTNSGLSNIIDKITLLFSKKNHQHTVSDISNFPTSMPANGGNAATVGGHTVGVNVPSNAKFTDTTYSKLSEFTDDVGYVTNTDARLTDARNAKDVYAWAKASTKPTYTASEVGLGNVGNFKAVSTVASQGLSNTEKSNARANIGAQVAGSYASSTHNHDDKYQAKGSYASASHTHGNGDITSLDAGKITSGTISIDRLPQGALERLTVVTDDTARFKLTSATVQKGDTVKVTSTGKMYYVVDETKLSSEAGYEVYAAGTAASVPWSGVTGKPSSYTPSSHTHDDRYYTESEIDSKLSGKANSSHTHDLSTMINSLLIGTDTPSDNAYYISQHANGGTTNTLYFRRPVSALWSYIKGKADKVYAAITHTHTKSQITDFPTSMPASDVSPWAKASSKPSYTKSEVGLGNVDNTADSAKSVKYATSAGSATKSTGIVDYGATAKTIQIGYSGDGISGDAIKYIAGYTTGNGSDVNAKIKDVSKDALKSWLGLGSLAYSSATIPTIPSSLPANGGTADKVGHALTINYEKGAATVYTFDGSQDVNLDIVIPTTASAVGAVPTSGGTVNGAITFGKNDAYGIRTNTDNYGRIGDATNQFYEVYAKTIYENKTKLAEKYAEKSHTHSNYLTGITKSMVTSALGYTPPTSDTWRPLGTTADTACAGNDSRLSNARSASDVYAWAKESSPNNIFKGGTYTGNIDSYSDSTLQPGKSYYISTSNITSSYGLPFSGYGVLGSYVTASVIVQQIFRYNGSSKIVDGIYTRMYINSAWTSWSKVALTKVS